MLNKEEKTNKEFYNRISSVWDKKRGDLNRNLKEYQEFQKLVPSGAVIDLGCGSGRDAGLFVEGGYNYTGIDLSEGMISAAKSAYPLGDFRVMNLTKLDFPDESFDGIWSFSSYLHVPKDKIDQAIGEANRVLKSGGFGVVCIKKGSKEGYLGEAENRRFWAFYGKNQFSQILKRHGFKVLDCWEDKRDYNPPKDVSVYLFYLVQKA